MKAVAFVCLLSFSLCLSQATSQTGADVKPNSTTNKNATEKAIPPQEQKPGDVTKPPALTNATAPTETITANATEKGSAVQPTTQTQNATKLDDNKTEKASEAMSSANETKVEPPKIEGNKTKAAEETKTGEKDKDPTPTTEKIVPAKTTEAPKDANVKPLVAARGFDGPSFIGGIILTLGLLAIGFMGFKYYKNQTERNYHTL